MHGNLFPSMVDRTVPNNEKCGGYFIEAAARLSAAEEDEGDMQTLPVNLGLIAP